MFWFVAQTYSHAIRIMGSITFLVETLANAFLVYQTLSVLAVIAHHVMRIVRPLRRSGSKYTTLRKVELDLQLQRSYFSGSLAFLRSGRSAAKRHSARMRSVIAFGPALIASAIVLLTVLLVHGVVDGQLDHWADCETVNFSPNENWFCTSASIIHDKLNYKNSIHNYTLVYESDSGQPFNTSSNRVHLTTTQLITSSSFETVKHHAEPSFFLNICMPVSSAVALTRITLVLLLPCLLAFVLVGLFCNSIRRLQSLMTRQETRGHGLEIELLVGSATRYTGDSRPAKWCALTGFSSLMPPQNCIVDDKQFNYVKNETTIISSENKVVTHTEDDLSNDGPWVLRQQVQLGGSTERTYTLDTHSLSLPLGRHPHFNADESNSNISHKRKSIRVRERTVRKNSQESPLALSIQRNHSSLNREKLTRGRHIGSANVSEVRSLRSNLLYLTILTLLLTPSFVGSAAILLGREFFIFPDPISYPQSNIQIHPAVQNLQIHRESKLLYFFCWFNHSPVTALAIYVFQLLSTTITASLMLLLLLSQEKTLAHALRRFLNAPIAFYRDSSLDLNARLRLRNCSIYGSRYGSLRGSANGNMSSRKRTCYSAQLEFDAVVRSPLFEMQVGHNSSVARSPILDYRGVSAV